jgi:hypothetical protein
MTHQSKSFVARIVLGAVALAGVAAAVPASAHPYDGRDWQNDRGWAERGDGYRHDWRPVEYAAPGYYEGYRPDWRPVHYFHRHHYDRVVYVHGYDRRW